GPRALPTNLLSGLVADTLVRTNHLHSVDVIPPSDLDICAGQMEVDSRLPVLRAIHHPMWEGLSEVRERRLDLVRLLLREIPESLGPRDAREIGDRLGDPDADARDRSEGIGDRPRSIEVRVRHADDVAEIFLHALELFRPPRCLGLLLLLVLLLPAPFAPLGLRRYRRAVGLRARRLPGPRC